MKALVGAFNQEKAQVGAFSVIVKTDCETDGALHSTTNESVGKSVANKEKQRPLTVLIMCFILFSLATRRVSLHSTQLLLATNVQIKNFSMTEA